MDVLNLLNFSDTIIGIATPRGKGAIGVVRLSGKDSINLVQQIFSKPILEAPGGTFYYGNLYDSQEKLDDVIVSIFRAPNSIQGKIVWKYPVMPLHISCKGQLKFWQV